MKTIHPDLSEADRAAFLREVELLGQLEHPHIVPIHDVFREQDGRPSSFTMKLVEGETLAHLLIVRKEETAPLNCNASSKFS